MKGKGLFVKFFKDISAKSVREAGGKGASLGELTQVFGKGRNPVPPGFVVVSKAFDKFLEDSSLNEQITVLSRKVKPKDIKSVDLVSKKIRNLVSSSKVPKEVALEIRKSFGTLGARYVAVRSSATAEDSSAASWAGELETYLNVTKKDLEKSVQRCWSSLFTPRAIFYRYEKKLQHIPVSVAVVVQAMIEAEVSGICFTVHPVTKEKNQMIIEAGFGLGEAVVGGQITPDSYVVNKKNLSIIDLNVSQQNFALKRGGSGTLKKKLSSKEGSRQKLNQKQIVELALLCRKIESHYARPQDIEWSYARGKFFILQSRPITTLN